MVRMLNKTNKKKSKKNITVTEKKKKPVKKESLKSKKQNIILCRGKRKEAIARAIISPGKGRLLINGVNIKAISNKYVQEMIKEPLVFVGPELNKIDIKVYVKGGGSIGQAQAARTAIAKALVSYTKDEKLKTAYASYDRFLLIEDGRRVEPKKYKGPKARARFQKSYR